MKGRMAFLVALVVLAIGLPSSPASADTFAVNTVDDLDFGGCDAFHCSLREAIKDSNNEPGMDTISFNIPGGGVQTIQPKSALPTITDPVIIDGGLSRVSRGRRS